MKSKLLALTAVMLLCAAEANAGDAFRYLTDELYEEECGACHLAYPPQLLPGRTWSALLAGLADHFGENAQVSDTALARLEQYLQSHALGVGAPSRMSRMMHSVPLDPPLRITEFPAFVETHAVIKKQLEMDAFPTGFLSPCTDCHRQAAAAIFDKELLHPGYGPSVWGGPNSDSDP
jgi:hypothetical protein